MSKQVRLKSGVQSLISFSYLQKFGIRGVKGWPICIFTISTIISIGSSKIALKLTIFEDKINSPHLESSSHAQLASSVVFQQ